MARTSTQNYQLLAIGTLNKCEFKPILQILFSLFVEEHAQTQPSEIPQVSDG